MYTVDPKLLGLEKYFVTSSGVLALCESPEHDDNNPSMFINLSEKFCYCYSCGFICSIEELVDITGGEIKYVFEAPKNTAKDNQWIKKLGFDLGYNDEYLVKRGVTDKQITKYEIRTNENEVIFPLHDVRTGEPIGAKVRLKKPRGNIKYLTFGDMPLYYSNTKLNNTNKPFVVTEGIFGVLRYDKFGVNAISPLSVTRITPLKKVFEKYSNVDFVLSFDDDIAGYTAQMKLLFLCRSLKNVYGTATLWDVDEQIEPFIKSRQYVPSGLRTKDPLYYLAVIEHIWGKDIKEDVKKRYLKFVSNNV